MSEKENNLILVVDDEKDIVQAYEDFLSLDKTLRSSEKQSSRSARESVKQSSSEAPQESLQNTQPGNLSSSNVDISASDDHYEIVKAYSGEAALEIVKSEFAKGRRVAGGFFDVKMPGKLDGIQLIQQIWKIDPEVNCTIVTAYHDRSVQDIHKLFGPQFKDQWDYLNKPFTHGEILQKARQMIASWNKRRKLTKALSDLKEAQAQLIASERMAAIGQVARGIGHEFNNILQRIVGKADLALTMNNMEQIKQSLEAILQASEKAAYIIRNLQSFSKTSSEGKAIDAKKVFSSIISLLSHEFKMHSIEVVDKCLSTGQFKANEVEVQQVIMNIFINAMFAMPDGGKIEIGCTDEDGKINIWITDTGVGISSDILPRVFEYGFTTKGEKGSGLGLAICKKIVEAHHGTIDVQSVPTKGTKFILKFPKI